MHHLFANGHAIFAKHFPCIRKCRSFTQNSKEDVLILLMLVELESIFPKFSGEIISEMSFSILHSTNYHGTFVYLPMYLFHENAISKKSFNHFAKLTYK